MTALIRVAKVEDAAPLVWLHYEAVHSINPKFYRQHTLDSWSPAPDQGRFQWMRNTIEATDITVAVAQTRGPVGGFVIYSGNEAFIRALYVAPACQGSGLGRALLSFAEAQLRSSGRSAAAVNASLNAVGFYERAGYIPGKSSTQTLSDGTVLNCISMSKPLAPIA